MSKPSPSVKGFTLVEMLVAVAIFSVVMLMAVSALLSILDLDRKAQSLKSVMNNLNFTIDTMTREIRVGTDYCVPTPGCSSTRITFYNYSGISITYELLNERIFETRSDLNGGSPIPLTAKEVHIQNTNDQSMFIVSGESPTDLLQPYVLMRIVGYAGTGNSRTDLSLETFATQRLSDK